LRDLHSMSDWSDAAYVTKFIHVRSPITLHLLYYFAFDIQNINDIHLTVCHLYWQELSDKYQTFFITMRS